MATILNLTQHNATQHQLEAGVVDLAPQVKELLKNLLDFSEVPSKQDVVTRAVAITSIAKEYGASHVMIGGAPYLMGALEAVLKDNDIKPLYAFSQRVSVEKVGPDGTLVKTSEFKHIGFVEV